MAKRRKRTCSTICAKRSKTKRTYRKCLRACKKVKCVTRCASGIKGRKKHQVSSSLAKIFGGIGKLQ